MRFTTRFRNCCQIHWNGIFYILSPLALLPLVFLQPALEWRSLFIILWAFIWYLIDVAPAAATAILPIIALPVIGVLDSNDVCSCFARETNILFLLCNFIAATMQHCNIAKRQAMFVLIHMSCDPRIVLAILMVFAYLLTALLPAPFVCALMMPIVRAILHYLDDVGVCKALDETILLKDDETPYPSKVANGFYIGVAYAINIGSITSALSSESGLALRHLIKNDVSLSAAAVNFHSKYLIFSIPVSLLLLLFTIFCLEIIFLGLKRSESPEAKEILLNQETTKAAFDIARTDLPPFNEHMFLVSALSVCSLIGVVVSSVLSPEVDKKTVKYSANAMLLCFFYFVLPSSFDYCNYFRCTAPKEYKTVPSILPWGPANKLTPWKTLLVHGSGLAFGLVMKVINLHKFLGEGLLKLQSPAMQQLGFICLTSILTIMSSNNFVAEIMLNMGLQAAGESRAIPLLFSITWASCLTFLLPVSSSANCFALGWGNVRVKDMILAAIGPTFFGLLLVFVISLLY